MALELGSGYVTLIPSANGFRSKAKAAVGREMNGVGSDVGKKYAKEFVGSTSAGMKALPGEVKKTTVRAGKSAADEGGKAGKDFGKRFSSSASGAIKAGLVGVGAVATAGLATLVTGSRDAASEAEQSLGAVEAIFKKKSGEIITSSEKAAQAVGLSANEYRNLAAALGAQLKNKGIEDFTGQTQALIGVGADLAAQFGGSTTEAVDAINSALRGETDPIERYGVSMNQAALEAEALAKGIKKGEGDLTDQQKAMAALSIISKQTADAQGAFGRESETYAGKAQRAKAASDNLKASIGGLLLPVFTAVAETLNAHVTPALTSFVQGFKDGTGAGGAFADIIRNMAPFIQPVAAGAGAAATALLAYKAATTAASWATKGFTASLLANPLGIVVAAIGVLVASLVWLYQNNDTARAHMDAAWKAISSTVTSVWENNIKPAIDALVTFVRDVLIPEIKRLWFEVVQPVFQRIGEWIATTWNEHVKPALAALYSFVVTTLIPALVGFWRDVVQPVFRQVGDFIKATWENVLKPVLNFLWSFIKNLLIPLILFLWRGVVLPAFSFIGDIISIVWNSVIKPVLWILWATIKNVIIPVIMFLWKNAVKPAFDGIGGIISFVWESVVRPALDALAKAMEHLPSFFEKATEVIKEVWGGLRKIALAPVEFVVQTVLNQGLIKGINDIGKPFGVSVPYIPWTVQLNTGGKVPGWSPSATADNIPAWLTAGEFVTRQKSVNRMNKMHPGVLEHINEYGTLPAYARGGPVFDSKRPGKYMGGRTSPLRAGEYQRDQGVWRQMKTWLKQNVPGARVTSAFRQTRTATGKISNHARGLALDIVGSGSTSMMDIFNVLAKTFGGRSIELIHSPAGGRQLYRGRPHTYSGVTRANHFDHVHWSMPSMDPSIAPDFSGGDGGFFVNPFDMIGSAAKSLLDKIPHMDTFVGGLAKGIPTKFIEDVGKWFSDKATSVLGFGGSDSGGMARVADGALKSTVQKLAGQKGWGSGQQWDALQWIIGKESSWSPTAQNPRSTAYGLFQFLNGTWAGTGYRKTSDPQTQTMAGLKYIEQRYGDPLRARAFWQRNGHYADGGEVRPTLFDTGGILPPGLTLVSNQTNKPEMIRTYEQERALQDTLAVRNGGDTINITGLKYDAVPEMVRELDFQRNRLRARARFGG